MFVVIILHKLYADADATQKSTSPSVEVSLEFHMQQSIEIFSQLQVIPTKVIFIIQPKLYTNQCTTPFTQFWNKHCTCHTIYYVVGNLGILF